MRQNTLTIQVGCSAKQLFDFTLNPLNTPKWVDEIAAEETNEIPVRLGTIYRNKNPNGLWREFQITTFEEERQFVLSQKDGPYHVQYTFKPLADDRCELEYNEWVDKGELKAPVTQNFLNKLKHTVERDES